MNLGINGLYKLVSQEMDLPPLSGAVFIFFSKNRQQVKLLRWDTDGFTLYHATNSSPCASSRRYTMWGRFRCQGYSTPYQLPLPQEPQAYDRRRRLDETHFSSGRMPVPNGQPCSIRWHAHADCKVSTSLNIYPMSSTKQQCYHQEHH